MRVVCLDTHVLIWGFKKQASENRIHMVERATRFLDHLDKQSTLCIVPAPVVSELLMNLPPQEHIPFIGDLSQRYMIPSFDAQTAALLARVWQSKRGQVDMPRELIKFDSLIVATALAARAECIYSEDPDVAKIADGHIECKAIPVIPAQERLFDE